MPFPLDSKFIKRAEEKLGHALPHGYTAKMCQENGGEVLTDDDEWNLFPIYDDSDKNRMKRTCNDIVRETQSARSWAGFPNDAVAIAANGCGDRLVLLADVKSGSYSEAVYRWDHETGKVHKLGDGIEELMDTEPE